MKSIPLYASELILNPDNSVYHLHLRNEHIADTVILVGDQGRVEQISQRFSHLEYKVQNREFVTHTGIYNGCRLSVLSTGIGTDNIDIVMNELDAAVNIDPLKRKFRDKKRVLKLIRLGTSGAIQEDIPVDSFVISRYGLGFDGLVYYYDKKLELSEPDKKLENAIIAHLDWHPKLAVPYLCPADEDLYSILSSEMYSGITASATGFYGPQGRELVIPIYKQEMHSRMRNFSHQGLRLTNFEMETSALYSLGKLMSHKCCTCCVVLANRSRGEFTKDHKGSVDDLIDHFLDHVEKIDEL